VVIVIEEVWFAPGDWGGTPARAERVYAVGMHLFLAADEDGAYAEAQGWIDSGAFSDANHDGAGDRTHIFALGLHQLEEVGTFRRLPAEIREPGGVELPGISLADVDGDGVRGCPRGTSWRSSGCGGSARGSGIGWTTVGDGRAAPGLRDAGGPRAGARTRQRGGGEWRTGMG
jgi:hypothetical protein